ncbi:MAG TPA: hypothetical protein VF406_21915 [Thermodesulfobacteriota bacterium]
MSRYVDHDATALRDLRQALLRLHKALVDAERATYERDHGRTVSAGEMLQMLIEHPWFAWLRPLSTLVVRIDEALDADDPVTADEIRALREEARALVAPAEGPPGLGHRYRVVLGVEPAVTLAHGAVTRLLGAA